jgi:hypothetical protein
MNFENCPSRIYLGSFFKLNIMEYSIILPNIEPKGLVS